MSPFVQLKCSSFRLLGRPDHRAAAAPVDSKSFNSLSIFGGARLSLEANEARFKAFLNSFLSAVSFKFIRFHSIITGILSAFSEALEGHQFLSDDRESHMLRTCATRLRRQVWARFR